MVRERDRSIFTPTAAPRPLAPTIRMNPDQTTKQTEGRHVPGPDDRKQMLEHSIVPGQFKGRPNIDPEAIKSATPPPAHIQGPPPAQNEDKKAPALHERPQIPEHTVMPGQFRGRPNIDPEAVKAATPPPAHVPGPSPAQNEEKKAPVMHERSQIPEHPVMPDQFRGRQNIDADAIKAAIPPPSAPRQQIAPPPVPRPQQMAPPPPPAPVQGQPGHLDPEALKRLKKQQEEANKKD